MKIEKCLLLIGVLTCLNVRFLLSGGRPLRFSSDVDASSAGTVELRRWRIVKSLKKGNLRRK